MLSPHQKLPPIQRLKRGSISPEVAKIVRIHNLHQKDWSKLEKKIKHRNLSMKLNEDSSFMRNMWAFRDFSKDLINDVSDTSMFKLRKQDTMKKLYKQRLDQLFSPTNFKNLSDNNHKLLRSSMD